MYHRGTPHKKNLSTTFGWNGEGVLAKKQTDKNDAR